MNIYDVLERLVTGTPFASWEQATAVKLIGQMRQLNVLGTTARHLDPETHTCRQQGEYWPASAQCLICSAPMDVPPHECSPRYERWGMRVGTSQCKYCGKEI